MNLAVIPARGGSKRIPRKNIREFGGKPMIAWSIQAAKSSGLFDKILVSTDDDEIAQIALDHGAEVPFRRPSDLADDVTPTVPVIAQAITACRELGWEMEIVCCIYPCVPFLAAEDLAGALELLKANSQEGYTFPVAEFPSPVQRALRQDESHAVSPLNPEHAITRTQDLEAAFYDAGQFYWGSAETWLTKTNIHANAHVITLPPWRVVDIDTPEDWEHAERLHKAFFGDSNS